MEACPRLSTNTADGRYDAELEPRENENEEDGLNEEDIIHVSGDKRRVKWRGCEDSCYLYRRG